MRKSFNDFFSDVKTFHVSIIGGDIRNPKNIDLIRELNSLAVSPVEINYDLIFDALDKNKTKILNVSKKYNVDVFVD